MAGEETTESVQVVEPVAESVDTSVETSAATTVDTSADTTTVAKTADPPSPAFPDHESFGWDAWDKSVNALPEPVRPWAQRVYDARNEWVEDELKSRSSEMDNLRSIYDELIQGNEDPRLESATKERTELEARFKELETQHQTISREYEEYKTAIEEQIQLQGKAIADRFKEAYPEIWEDDAKLSLFGELLEEDWELESIPKVMELGEEAQALARKARSEGTPDVYALQLADRARSKPAKPRPGARLTSGSEGSAPSAHHSGPGKGDAKTIEDLRSYAVAKAIKLHGGRK